jgi:hypothetical protein
MKFLWMPFQRYLFKQQPSNNNLEISLSLYIAQSRNTLRLTSYVKFELDMKGEGLVSAKYYLA